MAVTTEKSYPSSSSFNRNAFLPSERISKTLLSESSQSNKLPRSCSLKPLCASRKCSMTPLPSSSNQSKRNQSSRLAASLSSISDDNSKKSWRWRLYSSLSAPPVANSINCCFRESARLSSSGAGVDGEADDINPSLL